MRYGEAIKMVREILGISQVELAKQVGWTQSAISECEKKDRVPSTKKHHQMVKFVKAKKIKIDWEQIFSEQ